MSSDRRPEFKHQIKLGSVAQAQRFKLHCLNVCCNDILLSIPGGHFSIGMKGDTLTFNLFEGAAYNEAFVREINANLESFRIELELDLAAASPSVASVKRPVPVVRTLSLEELRHTETCRAVEYQRAVEGLATRQAPIPTVGKGMTGPEFLMWIERRFPRKPGASTQLKPGEPTQLVLD